MDGSTLCASETASPAQRIAVLLDHPGIGDSRVHAQLRSLAEAGYVVGAFMLVRPRLHFGQEVLEVEGTTTRLVVLEDADIVPWLSRLRREKPSVSQTSPERGASAAEGGCSQFAKVASPAKAGWKARINRTLGALFWHRAMAAAFMPGLAAFRPDLIIANDLTTLGAGVAGGRATGGKMLYDAHEYERGRNGVEPTLAEAVRMAHEDRLIGEADAVSTVGVAIARLLQRDHRLPVTPTVLLNATSDAQAKAPSARTTELRASLDLGGTDHLHIYWGSLAPGRGLEVAVDALALIAPDTRRHHLAVMGNGTVVQRERLRERARARGVADRLHMPAPVPRADVVGTVAQADSALIPIQSSCTSYRYCVPNKLFQSRAAGLPVVSTPLPEIEAILERTGGGITANDWSASALAEAMMRAGTQPPNARLSDDAAYSWKGVDARRLALVGSVLSRGGLADPTPLPHADDPALNRDALRRLPTHLTLLRRMLARSLVSVFGRI